MQLGEIFEIAVFIQRQEAISIQERMSANDEIHQHAFWITTSRFPLSESVTCEPLSGFAPDMLAHVKIDTNPGVMQKSVYQILSRSGVCAKFSVNQSTDNKLPASLCLKQIGFAFRSRTFPGENRIEDVRIDGGPHGFPSSLLFIA